MGRNFVNNRLVTVKRFAPGHDEDSEPSAESADSVGEPLDEILKKEDHRTRQKVVARDTAETGRRREEIFRGLSEIVVNLEAERDLVREKLARFAELRKTIAALPEDVGAERLGEIKRAVREAHLELVKHHRESLSGDSGRGGGGGVDWVSLSMGQLTRIGFGLGWPVMVALLLAAALVAMAMAAVFGVG